MVQQEDIDQLKQILRGRLIGRADPDYDGARKLYNAAIGQAAAADRPVS